jgi:putative acetyltransferase
MIKLVLTKRSDEQMTVFNLRNYQRSDLEELVALFNATVQAINKKDYTEQQIEQLVQPAPDYDKWDAVLASTYTRIVLVGTKIIGFGNISKEGYLDHLYVSKEWIGYGAGKLLANDLIDHAFDSGAKEITVHSSLTAKSFFEKLGFRVVKQNNDYRNGVLLLNYLMIYPKEKYI